MSPTLSQGAMVSEVTLGALESEFTLLISSKESGAGRPMASWPFLNLSLAN